MLFNSHVFLFAFLPMVLAGYYIVGKIGSTRWVVGYLVAVSFVFYGWWSVQYLALMAISIALNFLLGRIIEIYRTAPNQSRSRNRKWLLAMGVAANLGVLGYFKYSNFFIDNVNSTLGSDITLAPVLLPIAISFFTFQQIGYLMDGYRSGQPDRSLLRYALFISFFPQLIAGPIVHHSEMLSQYASERLGKLRASDLAIGGAMFTMGLFKKVVVADGIAAYATPVFNASAAGEAMTMGDAWIGGLAYTFQLYFDFSGYADMAIGLGRMLGIRLPINFYSPYKATSIIDFWQRWHMTLSRFLSGYVYIPLGGNRRGPAWRSVNLMLTMLIGGLWHGAGWTFVFWGGLHGTYLVINHAWRGAAPTDPVDSAFRTWVSRLFTFLLVSVSLVIFRADSMDAAGNILQAMFWINGMNLDAPLTLVVPDATNAVLWLVALLGVVWFAPNTYEIMSRYRPAINLHGRRSPSAFQGRLKWQPSLSWGVTLAVAMVLAVILLNRTSEFLYYQF
jgi:alginate O-acetyltransferase complex protein AlgI